jgi:aryl-alcohol dehydrogenase-like predicted oxidoreductase
MSSALGVSPHALVVAWVLAQGPTVVPIPSARRVEHLRDSLRAADLTLSEADRRAIDEAEFDRK